MKKFMIGFVAAAVVSGTMAQAAESVVGFVEVGPGLAIPATKGTNRAHGGQATAGIYLGQSDLGAFRIAGTLGYYSGSKEETLAGIVKTGKSKYEKMPLFQSVAYEFNLAPVRLRLGPLAGVMFSKGKYNGLNLAETGRSESLVFHSSSGNSTDFTYGGLAGLAVDLTDSLYVTADYIWLGTTEKGSDGTHLATLSLGFKF